MTEKPTKKKINPEKTFKWRVLVIFVLVIAFICGAVFIFDYYDAYNDNTDGGWIPPSAGVVFFYFQIAVFSLIAAFVLKMIYRERVSIIAMMLAAIFVPILCYNFNYHSLKKDTGFLYPLVDRGGIFYFILNEDYNLDGITDKYYEKETKTRTLTDTHELPNSEFSKVTATVTGVGYIDSNYVLIQNDWLYDFLYCYGKSPKNTYESLSVDMSFKNKKYTDNVTVYLVDINKKEFTPLETERIDDLTLRATLTEEYFEPYGSDLNGYFYFAVETENERKTLTNYLRISASPLVEVNSSLTVTGPASCMFFSKHDDTYDFSFYYHFGRMTTYESLTVNVTFDSDVWANKAKIYLLDIDSEKRTELKTERTGKQILQLTIPAEYFKPYTGRTEDSQFYFDVVYGD